MKLKHKNYAICVLDLFLLVSDNYIDGAALIGLQEDFTEFKQMVPQSGLRLKLKGLIGKCPSMIYVSSFQIYNKDQSVVCLVCSLRLNPRGIWHLVSFPDCISCTCSKLGLVNYLFHSPSSAPE